MRDLTVKMLLNAVKNDIHAQVLCLRKRNLSSFGDEAVRLDSPSFIDASENELEVIDPTWERFPNAWWLQLSHNNITAVPAASLPVGLGLLDLTSNAITDVQTLDGISKCHIFRLNLIGNPFYKASGSAGGHYSTAARGPMLQRLPLVWVLDDDFVSILERNVHKSNSSAMAMPAPSLASFDSSGKISLSRLEGGALDLRILTEREGILLRVIQEVPQSPLHADNFRLQVLLEDYLEQCRIYNKHGHNGLALDGGRLASVNLFAILRLPHKIRLDLSVLLTASILFPLPIRVLNEALIQLLSANMTVADINQFSSLPLFVRTALVSLIRRICRRELDEITSLGAICSKPTLTDYPLYPCYTDHHNVPDPILPTFIGPAGYTHLRPVLDYLTRSLDRVSSAFLPTAAQAREEQRFSDLEMEILTCLPDAPTLSTCPAPGASTYKDWLCFTARHAVLLLKKAPSCPLLTRGQTTQSSQSTYEELLPILRAASMTYSDLDIEMIGEGKDGRVGKRLETNLSSSNVFVGGKVLAFGVGIPAAGPSSLSWNTTKVSSRYAAASHKTASLVEEGEEEDINRLDMRVLQMPRIQGEVSTQLGSDMQPNFNLSMDDSIFPKSDPGIGIKATITKLENINDTRVSNSFNRWEVDLSGRKSPPVSSPPGTGARTQSPSRIDISSIMLPPATRHPDSSKQRKLEIASGGAMPAIPAIFNDSPSRTGNPDVVVPGSPIRQKAGVTSIGAFAANASWSPSFLLAPVEAVAAHNTVNVHNAGEVWSTLEDIPVIMHPLARNDLIRIELDADRTANSRFNTGESVINGKQKDRRSVVSPMNDVILETQDAGPVSPLSQPTSRPGSPSATNGVSEVVVPVVSAVLPASAAFEDDINDDDDASVKSDILFIDQGLLVEDARGKLTEPIDATLIDSPPKPDPVEESVPEAARRLLAEMGTLKNLRTLAEYNVNVAASRVQSKLKAYKMKYIKPDEPPQVALSDAAEIDLRPVDNGPVITLPAFSWTGVHQHCVSNRDASTAVPPNPDMYTFMTGTGNEEDDEEEMLGSGIDVEDYISDEMRSELFPDQMDGAAAFPTGPVKIISTTEMVRRQANYNNIHTIRSSIDQGITNSSGYQISSPLFPVFGKFMFTLAPDTLPMSIRTATLRNSLDSSTLKSKRPVPHPASRSTNSLRKTTKSLSKKASARSMTDSLSQESFLALSKDEEFVEPVVVRTTLSPTSADLHLLIPKPTVAALRSEASQASRPSTGLDTSGVIPNMTPMQESNELNLSASSSRLPGRAKSQPVLQRPVESSKTNTNTKSSQRGKDDDAASRATVLTDSTTIVIPAGVEERALRPKTVIPPTKTKYRLDSPSMVSEFSTLLASVPYVSAVDGAAPQATTSSGKHPRSKASSPVLSLDMTGNFNVDGSAPYVPHAQATAKLQLSAGFTSTVPRLAPSNVVQVDQLPLPPISARSRSRRAVQASLAHSAGLAATDVNIETVYKNTLLHTRTSARAACIASSPGRPKVLKSRAVEAMKRSAPSASSQLQLGIIKPSRQPNSAIGAQSHQVHATAASKSMSDSITRGSIADAADAKADLFLFSDTLN